MKRQIPIVFVISFLVMTIFFPICGQSNVVNIDKKIGLEKITLEKNDEDDLIAKEIIIKFLPAKEIEITYTREGYVLTGIESIDQLNIDHKITYAEELFSNTCSIFLKNIYKFSCDSNTDIQKILKDYNKNSNVIYVEPNYVYHFCETPNDPYFNEQWSLDHIRDFDIDAPEAWDIETGDSDIVIGIVDSGIDYYHSDLSTKIWINEDEIPSNNVDDDNNGFIDDYYGWNFYNGSCYPGDIYGHGTHCAGIAGAVSNNSLGITGLCWDCKLMAVTIGVKSIKEEDAANGIIYATDNGADIISMSWGGTWYSYLIEDAIDYSYSLGVCLIAAAGNEGLNITLFPASLEKVMAVAATDVNGNICEWSNYGDLIDVAAPGNSILSTVPLDEYSIKSGTSMATPHVSGLAALLLSKNPSLTFSQIRKIINQSADRYPPTQKKYVGAGKINAYEALLAGVGQAEALIEFPVHGNEVEDSFNIIGSAWGNGFHYYKLEYCLGVIPHLSDNWIEIVNSSTQIYDGNLGFINTNVLNDLGYRMRLTVVCNDGIYRDTIWFIVNNYKNTVYVDDDNTNGPWYGTVDFPYNLIEDAFFAASVNDAIFVKSGEYTGGLNIWKSLDLIGEDKNNTIIDATEMLRGIILTAGYVNLTGFSIIESTFNGIEILSRHNNIFDNIFSPHSYRGIEVKNSFNNIFENIFCCSKNYFYGVRVTETSDILISHNYMANNSGGFAIHLFYSRNIMIKNNILWNNDIKIEGDELSHWNTHTIEDNTYNNKPIRYYKNTNNIVVPIDTVQLIIVNCNNCQIHNLELSEYCIGAAIQIAYSSNIKIFNNNFYYSSFGCYFYKCSNNTFFENYMDDVSNCLFFYSSCDNQIFNNFFRDCTHGITLDEDSNYNEISNITINNSLGGGWDHHGIGLSFSSSNFNKAEHCELIHCNFGYDTSFSTNNVIIYCNFTGCWYAIWALTVSEKDNVFHHNNFVNNENNRPYFVDDKNYWDDGKEGNFWDDYIGLKYPRLYDKNRDGIGDVSYVVDGVDNVDHYPLMYQVGAESHSIDSAQNKVYIFKKAFLRYGKEDNIFGTTR